MNDSKDNNNLKEKFIRCLGVVPRYNTLPKLPDVPHSRYVTEKKPIGFDIVIGRSKTSANWMEVEEISEFSDEKLKKAFESADTRAAVKRGIEMYKEYYNSLSSGVKQEIEEANKLYEADKDLIDHRYVVVDGKAKPYLSYSDCEEHDLPEDYLKNQECDLGFWT